VCTKDHFALHTQKLINTIGKITQILVGRMMIHLSMSPKDFFLQGQSQINQNIMQNIQESKNSLNRIVSYLDESEQEFFPVESLPNPRTQCGENEVNSSSG